MAATTRYPVVLIHGLFGYGTERPLWNLSAPYWPENAIHKINTNVVIVDVGAVSSDHDRACELFYQLAGGTVDYGEAHARETGHARFGRTYDVPLHPTWSAAQPVHLVGHSMGSTTAIELYQLLCDDAFGVGSDHHWVRSITCIAGPLTGTTVSHMCGLHGDELVPGTPAHLLVSGLGLYFKLYHVVPMLRGLYDLKAEQWKDFSVRDVVSVHGRVNRSLDLAMFTSQPARRITRNSQLKHMDKLFLMSITTSARDFHMPKREMALAVAVLLLGLWKRLPLRSWLPAWTIRIPSSLRTFVAAVMALELWRRSSRWNYAKMPSLFALTWLMRRRARSLHEIYDGFDGDHWQHNDGAVNIHSMLRPWFPTPQQLAASKSATNLQDAASTRYASSSPSSTGLRASTSTLSLRSSPSMSSLAGNMARCASHISIDAFHREIDYTSEDEYCSASSSSPSPPRFDKGRWYVYRVDTNHLAGTYWDKDAGDLYKSLFTMIIDEYEQEPHDREYSDLLPKPMEIHVRDSYNAAATIA